MSRRQGSRVQAPDLRPRQDIQPAPLQSDTFRGAPRVANPGQNYFALAEALGGFSKSLSNLSAVQQQEEQDTTGLQNEFSRLTSAQQRDVARTGRLPDGRVIYDAAPALMKAAGRADAIDFARELRDEMQNDFNWESGDIDAHLTQRQNEYLEQSGITDEMAQRGFFEEMSRVRGWAENRQEEFHGERTAEVQDDVAFKNLEGDVYRLLEEDYSPDEFPRQVRGLYKDLGQEGTLGMGYDKLDRWVMSLAGAIADEHPEHAIALIDTPREGAGPASDPLSSKITHRGEADRIRERATKVIGANELEHGMNEVFRNNIRRVVEDGDYSRFEDTVIESETTGDTHEVTADEQREHFQRNIMQWGQSLQEQERVSQRVVDTETMHVLMNMGMDHPAIKEELDGIETRFGVDALQDEGRMEDITNRVDRWRSMKETYRTYVSSQLSEDTNSFLGTVDALIRTRGMDTPRAVEMAQRAFDPGDRGMRRSFGSRMSSIDEAIDTHMDKRSRALGFLWKRGDAPSQSEDFAIGTARAAVQRDAEILYSTGEYTEDRAIEIAAENYSSTVPHFRGSYIVGLEQYPRHERWQDGLNSIMGKFEEQFLPSDDDEQEATVRHYGGGTLVVTDMDGQVLLNENGQAMTTDINEVNQEAARLIREGDSEAIRDATDRQRRRQRQQPSREDDGRPDAFTPSVRPQQTRRGIHQQR